MVGYPKQVVDIMRGVVASTATNVLPVIATPNNGIKSLAYMYGSLTEMLQTIAEKQKSPTGKYDVWPAVLLFTDIDNRYGDHGGYFQKVSLQLAIAMPTRPDWKAADRLQQTFKPVLYPIWQELIKQIARCGCFAVASEKQISYLKWDRYYWGRTKSVFNDYCDAIEIRDLQLTLTHGKQATKAPAPVPADSVFSDAFNTDIFA